MGAIKRLFKPDPAPRPQLFQAPTPLPEAPQPTYNSPQVQEERRIQTSRVGANGRQSTVLTGDPAPTYSNDLLGE